jgi:6-phosphogluconate dehydrogenase
MRAAAKENKWDLNYGGIALMWRGGCIIRSASSEDQEGLRQEPDLPVNLLLDPFFKEGGREGPGAGARSWPRPRKLGIPVPAIGSALAYFDGYRTARLPANLLQAQRDYFGAHTYERTDKPRGEFFHTNWTGRGGNTSSSAYVV